MFTRLLMSLVMRHISGIVVYQQTTQYQDPLIASNGIASVIRDRKLIRIACKVSYHASCLESAFALGANQPKGQPAALRRPEVIESKSTLYIDGINSLHFKYALTL